MPRFPDVEQVDDSVLRFTRKAGEQPFAVYYLDIAQDPPSSQEMLRSYQDRVIGKHYFDGKKSLQWSNYLYFITSGDRLASSQIRLAKGIIERDRSYARKFVITEDELDSVLAPDVFAPATATPHASILSIWTDRLVEAGLDKAILSEDDVPTRLKLIEASSTVSTPPPERPRRAASVRAEPFIRSLQLRKYRDFPLQRSFDFGTVNLIFGSNGTGKTSLLEAIELFYCGRNKRNPDAHPSYELRATFADGRPEVATEKRALSKFRERNLSWYGDPEVKTNNLYLSFAQFNFLDTDAAVSLADSKSRADSKSSIEDDLSKLLVGPDASKTWRNIQRVHEALIGKLRDLRPLETQTEDEIATLESWLNEASDAPQESDSIRTRLEEMINRLGWTVGPNDKQTFAVGLVEALSELVAVAQQATTLNWTEAPVSKVGLDRYCREARLASDKAETDIGRLELLRKDQNRLADEVIRVREALDLARELMRFIDAGLPNRVAERRELLATIATYSGWLAGIGRDSVGVFSDADLELPVAVCHDVSVARRSATEKSLVSARDEHAAFSRLRDQSLTLAQDLRHVAARILQTSSEPDECPLCHTRFEPGELAKHMTAGLDQQLESLSQAFLVQIRTLEGAVRDAITVEATLTSVREFCKQAQLAPEISVRSALAEVASARRALAEARGRLDALDAETRVLESEGLSVARLDEASNRLRAVGHPLAESSPGSVDLLVSALDERLAIASAAVEPQRRQVDELQRAIETTLSYAEPGVHNLKGEVAQLKERLAATERVQAKLGEFSSSFPWPGQRPIAELVVEAESVRKVAAEMHASLGREARAKASYVESMNRKELLERKVAELRPRLKRLTEASSALELLQREHSLNSAMESALQLNRAGIETIFSRIHSPAEFRGLGSKVTTLVRKTTSKEDALSEVSSGQRAAFALSIFLAQNAQLYSAPPVILIDDPIAHVDDLNSLSFLDYLRKLR